MSSLLVTLISIPQSTTPSLVHYQKMYILTNIQTKTGNLRGNAIWLDVASSVG
mgnify:CR=1 FL=1